MLNSCNNQNIECLKRTSSEKLMMRVSSTKNINHSLNKKNSIRDGSCTTKNMAITSSISNSNSNTKLMLPNRKKKQGELFLKLNTTENMPPTNKIIQSSRTCREFYTPNKSPAPITHQKNSKLTHEACLTRQSDNEIRLNKRYLTPLRLSSTELATTKSKNNSLCRDEANGDDDHDGDRATLTLGTLGDDNNTNNKDNDHNGENSISNHNINGDTYRTDTSTNHADTTTGNTNSINGYPTSERSCSGDFVKVLMTKFSNQNINEKFRSSTPHEKSYESYMEKSSISTIKTSKNMLSVSDNYNLFENHPNYVQPKTHDKFDKENCPPPNKLPNSSKSTNLTTAVTTTTNRTATSTNALYKSGMMMGLDSTNMTQTLEMGHNNTVSETPTIQATDSSSKSLYSLTHKLKQDMLRRKELRAFFTNVGQEYNDKKTMRKELEQEVKLLENRVKRLQLDEDDLKKKLVLTEEGIKRNIELKKKQSAGLNELLLQKEREKSELQKRKKLISKERIKTQTILKQKLNLVSCIKKDAAREVREEVAAKLKERDQLNKVEHDKASQKAKKEFGKFLKLKDTKAALEEQMKISNELMYQERMRKEGEIAEKLQEKLRSLAKLEANLIERISMTTSKIMRYRDNSNSKNRDSCHGGSGNGSGNNANYVGDNGDIIGSGRCHISSNSRMSNEDDDLFHLSSINDNEQLDV